MKIFLKIVFFAFIGFTTENLHSMDDSKMYIDIPSTEQTHSDASLIQILGSSYPPKTMTFGSYFPEKPHSSVEKIRITCRIANESDIPDLLKLFEEIASSADDSRKLVVFPEHSRQGILERYIRERKFFIARRKDPIGEGPIVSFLKLYVVSQDRDLRELYQRELRCLDTHQKCADLESLECYEIDPEEISFDDSEKIPFQHVTHDLISFLKGNPVVIYYGGAYTTPLMRGKKFGSFLLRCAFSSIRALVSWNIKQLDSDKLILAYGQVLENQGNTLMRRKFVEEIPHINAQLGVAVQSRVRLFHHVYHSYMPAFTETEEILPDDDEREGRGNLIIYNLPSGKLTLS